MPHAVADRYEVERVLSRLYRFEGRVGEVRQILRDSLVRSPNPAADLEELWFLDNSPLPIEALGYALEHADSTDDRVWLGQANHAIATGHFDEARSRLASCRQRRPDDPAVWRSCLELALASDDRDGAWQTLSHLGAWSLSETENLELQARLIALEDNPESERRAWNAVLAKKPSHPFALERMAALAARSGATRQAESYHLRKTKIDRAKDRFRDLLLAADFQTSAGELAELAGKLGNPFQARAWSLLARHGRDGWPQAARTLVADSRDQTKRLGKAASTLAERLAAIRPEKRSREKSRDAETKAAAPTRPQFVDEAEAAGLRFTFDHGVSADRLLPETMSGGVALLDFDGDGWLDVFVVQGGSLEDDPARPREPDRLFRNRRDGTFEDVTKTSGLATMPRSYGLGATVGDFDNDGDPDLFLTRLRSYQMLRNRGDGTFEDATEATGLAGSRDNPTSAAFADLDRDGDLDLYVCHYMIYDPDHPVKCLNEEGKFFYCDPSKVQAAPDHLFRNDGGRFVDVTGEVGIVDSDGRSLGVVAADLDDDGWTDLYVANDGTANHLFRNLGGLRFEEVGLSAGASGSGEGGYQASMGVACGDLDRDGRLDLVVTNFYGEGSTLYHNLGSGLFTDWSNPSGLNIATRYLLGFGTAFLDFDNDGRLDLVTANGHVNDNRPFYPYAMPSQLLAGTEDGRLVDVSSAAGPPWDVPRVGRGLAIGDLDNDGREDVLILSQGQPLAYLHNQTEGGHSLSLGLEGARSNHDAIGARVSVVAGGRRQVAERFGGGSYQSASSPRLHFGLGDATQVEAIEVRWPSGLVERFEGLATNARYRIREGEGRAERSP